MARQRCDPATYVICKLCDRKFRAINVFHLRTKHGFEGEHPILDYKSEFDLAYAMCGDSRRLIGAAKEEFWDERGQHRTPETVMEEIRRRQRSGKSLRGKQVPVWLYEIARRLFATWAKAVEAAGFDYEQVTGVRRWTREKVIETIKHLALAGSPLDATSVMRQHSALYRAATRLFPRSWRKALRAADIDPEAHVKSRGSWDIQGAEEWTRKTAAARKSLWPVMHPATFWLSSTDACGVAGPTSSSG